MNLIDNIKRLYSEDEIQDNLQDFRDKVAEHFGVKEVTVRVGWFYRFDIPTKYNVQEHLIEFMQKYIKLKRGVPTQSEAVK